MAEWSSSYNWLVSRLNALHVEHGVGGDPVHCFACVVAVLNEQESEYVRRDREVSGGGE